MTQLMNAPAPMLTQEELTQMGMTALQATQGEWAWFGNTDNQHLYLATKRNGRVTVMDFVRYGMQRAQPRFQVRGLMQKASNMVVFEVCPDAGPNRKDKRVYRADVVALDHPDAKFMATFHPFNVLRMLKELNEMRDVLKNIGAVQHGDGHYHLLCPSCGRHTPGTLPKCQHCSRRWHATVMKELADYKAVSKLGESKSEDDPRILHGAYVEWGGAIYYEEPKEGEFGLDDLPKDYTPAEDE